MSCWRFTADVEVALDDPALNRSSGQGGRAVYNLASAVSNTGLSPAESDGNDEADVEGYLHIDGQEPAGEHVESILWG